MLEKKPDQILIRALMGMIPKNDLRRDVIKQNVVIFNEPYHNFGRILPQFNDHISSNVLDINEDVGIANRTPDNTKIVYQSSDSLPEEFANFPVEIDEHMDTPLTIRKKTHRNDSANFKLGIAARSNKNYFRKYKKY